MKTADETISVIQFPGFQKTALFSARKHWFLFGLACIFAGVGLVLGPVRALVLGSDLWPTLVGLITWVAVCLFVIASCDLGYRWHEMNVVALCIVLLGVCFFSSGSILQNVYPDRVIVVNGTRTSLTHKYLVATPFDEIQVLDRVWLITAGVVIEREGGEITIKVAETHILQCVFPVEEHVFLRLTKEGKRLGESLRRHIESAITARHRGDFFPMFSPTDRMVLEELVRIDLKLAGFAQDTCTLAEPEIVTTMRQVFAYAF